MNSYYVESRRGGGGFVTIKRIKMGKSGYFMHIIASIGSSISLLPYKKPLTHKNIWTPTLNHQASLQL